LSAPVRRLTGSESEALATFGKVDILHDSGIWLRHNHRLAVLAEQFEIPRIVSTRGMLEPWALRHKAPRKKVAWCLYQKRDLKRAQRHHATGEVEAENLKRLRLGIPVVSVPNGVVACDTADHDSRQAHLLSAQRTALFLGRIYPVKGLPILIEAWSHVRPPNWKLKIAGPDEGGHRAEIERAISAARLSDTITFLGPLEGAEKAAAFCNSDLFILPSHSESFGMAIAEALAHGLPVLTTTRTPWRQLTQLGCGWQVEPSAGALATGLRRATNLALPELQAMGERGRAYVTAEFGWKSIAHRFLAIYQEMLSAPAATLG
jgi:glycosyltransferase involved in cell wall biosynthesis